MYIKENGKIEQFSPSQWVWYDAGKKGNKWKVSVTCYPPGSRGAVLGARGYIQNLRTWERWDLEENQYLSEPVVIHNVSYRLPKYIQEKVVPEMVEFAKKEAKTQKAWMNN